jgi:hypothetical protein
MMPIALALVAVGILVAAGALFFLVTQGHNGSSSSPSIAASEAAIASASETPTLEATPTDNAVVTPTPVLHPTPTSTFAGTTGTWTPFTAPDSSWSISFPGTSAPTKTSEPISSGALSGSATFYTVAQGSSAYIVAFIDFPSSALAGMDTTSLLMTLETGMNSSLGGTLTSDTATTVEGYPAREVSISTSSLDYVYQEFFVGSRWYWLVTGGVSGSTLQADQFFSSFSLS